MEPLSSIKWSKYAKIIYLKIIIEKEFMNLRRSSMRPRKNGRGGGGTDVNAILTYERLKN